jgi:(S)-citramalyl-CoA lyase
MSDPKKQPNASRRSYIGIPGLRPELFPDALAVGADMVGVDLEAGNVMKDKDTARKNVVALFEQPQADDGVQRYVRINCLREAFGFADVQAILATDSPPPVLMLPKVGTPEEVVWLDDLLTERGHQCRLYVIIETIDGLEAATAIGRSSPRIDGLFFGGHDMSAELRCQNAWQPLHHARSHLVLAAAAAGLDVVDTPFSDPEDLEGLKREAVLARELGFTGKGAVHPRQIPVLNDVFALDEAATKGPSARWYC